MNNVDFVLNIYVVIGIAAIAQGIFLGLFMFFKKRKQKISAYLLGILLLIFAFILTHDVLSYSRYMLEVPHFLGLGPVFTFTIGPLIFLYIRFICIKNLKLKWVDLLHFAPTLIVFFSRIDLFSMPINFKIEKLIKAFNTIDNNSFPNANISELFQHFIIWHLQPLIYLLLSIYLIYKYNHAIKDQFSDISKLRLHWMRNLLYGYLFIWFIESALEIVPYLTSFINIYNKPVSIVLMSIHIYLFNIIALNHKDENIGILIDKKLNDVFSKQKLPDDELRLIHKKILKVFGDDKIYKDGRLTLKRVSKNIDISSRYISLAINTIEQKNFFDFVNGYRVNEAKELLKNESYNKYTIAAIGELVGFNSRDAFYRAFKKEYNITPAAYKKSS